MKKMLTQLSILLRERNEISSNTHIAIELRRAIRNEEKDFIYISSRNVRDWRDKQTFPRRPEVKRALLKYFNKAKFSELVLSEDNLELLISQILYNHLKKVIDDPNNAYYSYDVRVLSAALNINASSTTLTQAIILNYLYSQARSKGIDDIKLVELKDLHHLTDWVTNMLKDTNGMAIITQHITQIWDDLALQQINFRSVYKIVLRYTLSILWTNKDYLI